MSKFDFSHLAILDLEEIWNYTSAKWSINQAEKYYDNIIAAANLLSKNPLHGKLIQHPTAQIYYFKVGAHYIFFQRENNFHIHIIRILHQKMDFLTHL